MNVSKINIFFIFLFYKMSYCDKLMKMSLKELKTEYYKCDPQNTVQKEIIKQIANKKKIALKKQNEEEKMLLSKKIINNNIDIILKSKLPSDDTFVKKRGKMEQYWESHRTRFSKLEPQYREEVEKDFTNNKLMERLNCEVDFRVNGNRKKEILKPYDDQNDFSDSEQEIIGARKLIH